MKPTVSEMKPIVFETFKNFRKDVVFVENYLRQFVVCVSESPTNAAGRTDTLVAKAYKCSADAVKDRRLKCGVVGKEYDDSDFTTIFSLTKVSAWWTKCKEEGIPLYSDVGDDGLGLYVKKKIQEIIEIHTPSQKQFEFSEKSIANPNLEIRIQLNAEQIKSLQETGELVITSKEL